MYLGIAGIGKIAGDYIELICTGRVPGVVLTALSSRNAEHLRQVQGRWPMLAKAALYTDYGEMLHSGKLDAVLICTPHAQHPAMALEALECGLPVLLEKPVGIDRTALAAVEAALAAAPQRTCGVMYVRRMSPCWRTVKQLVEAGTLGELVRATWVITDLYRTQAYYASGSWRGTWRSEGGGLLMTQASHQLDLLQWLCGMPDAVYARCASAGRAIEVENEATLLLHYPNGAHGQFIASAHESPGANRLELCGTKASILVENDRDVTVARLETDEREHAEHCPDAFTKVPQHMEKIHFDSADNMAQQAAMIADFAAAVQEGRAPACTFAQGLNSLEIIRAAYLSDWTAAESSVPPDAARFETFYQKKS